VATNQKVGSSNLSGRTIFSQKQQFSTSDLSSNFRFYDCFTLSEPLKTSAHCADDCNRLVSPTNVRAGADKLADLKKPEAQQLLAKTNRAPGFPRGFCCVHNLKTGASFAGCDEAGFARGASDQALVRARPAYICWNVVRELDSLERAILIHEGAGFGRRASAYHGVSDDQV
jgi:hypothetical protein